MIAVCYLLSNQGSISLGAKRDRGPENDVGAGAQIASCFDSISGTSKVLLAECQVSGFMIHFFCWELFLIIIIAI